MAKVYYNDNDQFCIQWLRNLIDAGHLPDGDIDSRSIKEIQPDDLKGYTQLHFFAGIGGWPYALKLAGWPADIPVWTGSCPCQPISGIGKRQGVSDERHLWPIWFGLIQKCRPSTILGEQVARAVRTEWFDTVALNLEMENYAVGAAVLPACAVSAPHERQRLYFVANANGAGLERYTRHGAEGDEPRRLKEKSDRYVGAESLPHHKFEWQPEPNFPRVADGIPARVAKLRSLGNSLVPQIAAEFIKACLETICGSANDLS